MIAPKSVDLRAQISGATPQVRLLVISVDMKGGGSPGHELCKPICIAHRDSIGAISALLNDHRVKEPDRNAEFAGDPADQRIDAGPSKFDISSKEPSRAVSICAAFRDIASGQVPPVAVCPRQRRRRRASWGIYVPWRDSRRACHRESIIAVQQTCAVSMSGCRLAGRCRENQYRLSDGAGAAAGVRTRLDAPTVRPYHFHAPLRTSRFGKQDG